MKSLLETLHLPGAPLVEATPLPVTPDYSELTGKQFAKAVLNSEEFKKYIVDGIKYHTIPPALVCRLIDHGWGKPPEKFEHTGKDGQAMEVIRIVRVIVDPRDETEAAEAAVPPSDSVH